jgi:hypothetical protein
VFCPRQYVVSAPRALCVECIAGAPSRDYAGKKSLSVMSFVFWVSRPRQCMASAPVPFVLGALLRHPPRLPRDHTGKKKALNPPSLQTRRQKRKLHRPRFEREFCQSVVGGITDNPPEKGMQS